MVVLLDRKEVHHHFHLYLQQVAVVEVVVVQPLRGQAALVAAVDLLIRQELLAHQEKVTLAAMAPFKRLLR